MLTRSTSAVICGTLLLLSVSGSAGAARLSQPSRPVLLTDAVPDPHQDGVLWFAPTGHTLRGAFLDYWTHYGGLPQFGYPITEEFVEPASEQGKGPLVVQYFQRNRFEHHPENAGTPYEVLLGSLGLDFHTSDPPAAPTNDPRGRFFAPTGHNVVGPFRDYWQTHGGLFVHGYPVTEQYYEQSNPTNGKSYLVQYFERSRMEWHPEYAGTPYEVLLGLLGVQLAQKKGYFYGWYPAYGHAADFSWASGVVTLYGPTDFTTPWAGCVIFQYDEDGALLQLSTPTGTAYRIERKFTLENTRLVIFGHLAEHSEPASKCNVYPNAPRYIVNYIESNPAQ